MKKLFVCLLGVVSFSVVSAQKSYTYKFTDASTGPEFSRNIQIDVSKTNVHFQVFAGDVAVFDENRAINKDHYKAFSNNMDACYLTKKSETQNAGCTGGTTDSFIITTKNGAKAVDGYVYHCGNADNGNVKGDIARAVKHFKDMVPGFDYKLSTTRK